MPANIDAPGTRLQVKPHTCWDARAYDHAAWLAPPTDSCWVIAGLRDSSGQSGDFIGHTIDRCVRYWVVQADYDWKWVRWLHSMVNLPRPLPAALAKIKGAIAACSVTRS